ncbi:MAG: Gfo/Idh/MocA family oxidoreductase [Lentisphaeria bacterium]|nr:Gfo/Idh/MocA family oxidoreductase [Lentisphaeria bacterium]
MASKKAPAFKKLRVAFIGTGYISASHIAAYRYLPETEIVAGCDIKPERLAWFKQQPGCENAKCYDDFNKMLKAEKIDLVDVCTPNGVHAPATIAALKAGCHVMVEKPMAMNPDECKQMNDAAAKAKKLLACGFQIRYTPAVQMCKRAVDEGLLGDILYVKVHAMRRRGVPNWGVFGQKDLQGGGPMIDIGVHQIESAHFAMGEPKPIAASGKTWTFLGNQPTSVACRWPNWDYKTYTVEDLCVGQVRFDNGSLMQIESSFCSHIEEDTAYWELMGTKGGFNSKTETLFHDMAGTMVNSKAGFLPNHAHPIDFISKLRDLTSAIIYGTPLHSSGEEGMAVQKIIDGLYRSADKGGAEVKIS